MMASSLKHPQDTRIHPHKFILWVSMASIVMMFAGLTSAYSTKRTGELAGIFPASHFLGVHFCDPVEQLHHAPCIKIF